MMLLFDREIVKELGGNMQTDTCIWDQLVLITGGSAKYAGKQTTLIPAGGG